MKRIIAIFISLVMLLSTVVCVTPVSSATQDGIDIPLIYIEGQGASLYRNYGTPEQEQIYPIQIPEGYIEEQVDKYLPVFESVLIGVSTHASFFCPAIPLINSTKSPAFTFSPAYT